MSMKDINNLYILGFRLTNVTYEQSRHYRYPAAAPVIHLERTQQPYASTMGVNTAQPLLHPAQNNL